MKIRYGFVSNSSSSSFTCDVCKDTAVDYDGECEIEYLTCKEGHQICKKHIKSSLLKKSTAQMHQVLLDDVDNWDHVGADERESERDSIRGMDAQEVEDFYNDLTCGEELDETTCPLCSFKILSDEDLLDYLLMLTGSTKKSMIDQALKSYPNYDAFWDAIKAHKKSMKEQGKK